MFPKPSAKVLSIVSRSKKALMYLLEKIHVLNKLHSGMSYTAVGHELNIKEASYIVDFKLYTVDFKQKYTWNKVVYWSIDKILQLEAYKT